MAKTKNMFRVRVPTVTPNRPTGTSGNDTRTQAGVTVEAPATGEDDSAERGCSRSRTTMPIKMIRYLQDRRLR